MNYPLIAIDIRYEQDLVLIRQRARQVSTLMKFGTHEQTAFSTAVSELARNAFRYAGHGRVLFSLRDDDRQSQTLLAEISDKGPGIADLKSILEGRYKSETGMGLGIMGARRLSDVFEIRSEPGAGTFVMVGKTLPRRGLHFSSDDIAKLSAELAQRDLKDPLEEIQQQNKELMLTLDDLRVRQSEIERLNLELAETNRGVVALYAELDEKADSLRKASEYKSRFLSDMTHELRTPLNAIISISRLLIDRVDGDLTSEQEKQVQLINKSASSLNEMVSDLLDLAKIEAGKTDVHLAEVSVPDLLAALRGMFRPLTPEQHVSLIVEEPTLAALYSDERKLSQILRNLVSNALKFTEKGEVRVRVGVTNDQQAEFVVSDTGIGIEAEHLDSIFNDFTQIDSGTQRRVRGTGLGLPLTRKLVRLLGGDIEVSSQVGKGSTFKVTLPIESVSPQGEVKSKEADRVRA